LHAFLNLSGKDKLLFFEALFFLFLAKVMLLILPFRHCLKFVKTGEFAGQPDLIQLTDLRYAIGRAGRLTFRKNICLVQSFAARWMLARRKINSELFIGAMLNENKVLTAHAWLTCQNLEIVKKADNYKILLKI
jgi:hypothetical protein